MDELTLRVSATHTKGSRDDYYDVLCDGEVVGSVHLRPIAPPPGRPWMWTLGYSHCGDRTPIYGFAATLEAAFAAFAKSWRREG